MALSEEERVAKRKAISKAVRDELLVEATRSGIDAAVGITGTGMTFGLPGWEVDDEAFS
jgi:hypothetical protein